MQCHVHVLYRTLPLQRPEGAPRPVSVEVDVSERVSVLVERASKLLGEALDRAPGGQAAPGTTTASAAGTAPADRTDALRRPRLFCNGTYLQPGRSLSEYRFANGQTAVFLLDCRPYFPLMTEARYAGATRPKYLITVRGQNPAFKYQKVKKLINCIYGNVTMYVKVYLQPDGASYAARQPLEYFAVKKIIKSRINFYNPNVAPSPEDPLMELSVQQFLGGAIAGGHPFVCKLHECCEDAENIYAIMEALQGAWANAIPEDRARALYTQVVLGLKHMFDSKVSHGDLTLENVMLSGDQAKAVIIDFGKPFYVPPECYPDTSGISHRFDSFYGDLWSIGVMLFIMLTGSPPVDRAYPTCQRYNMVCAGKILEMLDSWHGQVPTLSECARDLITRLLIPDPPQMRLRLDEILEHPWMTGYSTLLVPYKNFMRSV
eukprot:g4431.t1